MSETFTANTDGSLDAALGQMPDIEGLEKDAGLGFDAQKPAPDAPPVARDEAGKFKTKEPEPAKVEPDAKAAEPAADDDDPLVEFGSEEGAEPVREKLSKVWEGYQRTAQLEKDLEAAKGAVRTLTPPEVELELQKVASERQKAIAWAEQLRATLHVGEPNRDMLNPSSPTYDPTGYYEQLQRADAVKAYAQQLDAAITTQKQQADQEQRTALSARIAREQVALQKIWPELAQENVAQSVKSELAKHYGLDEETVKSVSDHRFFAMAKDALAYRSAKALEAKAVLKVSAKPKLVPSVARSTQTGNQRNAADARSRLATSGSLDDAVAALDGLF
jgi:hypothetical protein